MTDWFRKTFWIGYTPFERLFLALMIMIQITIFCIAPDNPLNLIAGVTGIVSSVLSSKGKVEFYFIGLIQIVAYMILAWQTRFYGVFFENVFYFITTTWCLFSWKKNLHTDEKGEKTVKVKKATPLMWVLSIVGVMVLTIVVGTVLDKIGSAQTYSDAATIVMSVLAQFLMIYRYREQWTWWIIVDLLCAKMWFVAGNLSMTVMCLAWTANCIYGWWKWNKLNKDQNREKSDI